MLNTQRQQEEFLLLSSFHKNLCQPLAVDALLDNAKKREERREGEDKLCGELCYGYGAFSLSILLQGFIYCHYFIKMRLPIMFAAFLVLLVSDGSALMIPSRSRMGNLRICSSSFLPVHVATAFYSADEFDDSSLSATADAKKSRPERKAQERAKKQISKKPKGKTRYKLNSNNIMALTKQSTADDVLQAIKRAQKQHDKHDLHVIASFLLDEVGESFAYGYRGSLLSRLAVAAMHMNDNDCARNAIQVRRTEYRPSMLPMESAAIIRGLLRLHNMTDALEVLDDELCLPLEVGTNEGLLDVCII
jgi:hypothetical protein